MHNTLLKEKGQSKIFLKTLLKKSVTAVHRKIYFKEKLPRAFTKLILKRQKENSE